MNKLFVIYFLAINLIGMWMMYEDKQRAKAGKWRIPEKRLFFFAAIGGALLMTFSMYQFRHKTKHFQFKYGFPLIAMIQIGLIFYVSFL